MRLKYNIFLAVGIWLTTFVIVGVVISELEKSGVNVIMELPVELISVYITLSTLPSVALIWLFCHYLMRESKKNAGSIIVLFSLCYGGSILGIILGLILIIKSIMQQDVLIQLEPSLNIANVGLHNWSFGGSISGVLIGCVIIYMITILNDT